MTCEPDGHAAYPGIGDFRSSLLWTVSRSSPDWSRTCSSPALTSPMLAFQVYATLGLPADYGTLPVQVSFLCEHAYVYCSWAIYHVGVFTSACVNVQTCLKARIFPRWCLPVSVSLWCVCVYSHLYASHFTLLYSIGRQSLTVPTVRLAANKPRDTPL